MPSLLRLKFARDVLMAGAITLCVLPALGEDAAKLETVRIQGTIEKSDAQTVIVHTKDGSSPALAITAKTLIVRSEPASLDQVKAGDFIASAAVKGEDGKLHSTELRIFPEALRGLGEGQRPMSEPDKTMTNASVTEVVTAVQGRVLKVKYKDGTSELIVGPDVPITAQDASNALGYRIEFQALTVTLLNFDHCLADDQPIGTNNTEPSKEDYKTRRPINRVENTQA